MQVCNVLYQPHLYFLFFGVIIYDCQLPKFTEKTHKIAQYCVQNDQKLSAGVEEVGGVGGGKMEGGETWELGEERHGCRGIDAPVYYRAKMSSPQSDWAPTPMVETACLQLSSSSSSSSLSSFLLRPSNSVLLGPPEKESLLKCVT